MGRAPCCSKVGLHRGQWTSREDALLTSYIQSHGEGNWKSLPKKAGLLRCGKSCRLRWMNYLRPDIKRGNISPEEEDLIIRLHSLLGNRWSLIAGRLPGRTDNEIKNYWNSHLSKKLKKQDRRLREEGSPARRGPKRSCDGSSDHQRNSSSSGSSSININNNNSHRQAGDHEIHVPKPIRIAPSRFMVRNCNTTTDVTDHNSKEDEAEAASVESGDPSCSGNSDEGILSSSQSDGAAGQPQVFDQFFESNSYFGVDFDLEWANYDFHNLQDHAVFDTLFQEYSQLLHSDVEHDLLLMDSFSDSVVMI